MPGEPCRATKSVQTKTLGNYPCGSGYKGQKKECRRELGGQYCPDDDDGEDVMFRTTTCETKACPGKIER